MVCVTRQESEHWRSVVADETQAKEIVSLLEPLVSTVEEEHHKTIQCQRRAAELLMIQVLSNDASRWYSHTQVRSALRDTPSRSTHQLCLCPDRELIRSENSSNTRRCKVRTGSGRVPRK